MQGVRSKKQIGIVASLLLLVTTGRYVYAGGDFVIFANPVQYQSAQQATVKISGVFANPTSDDQLLFSIPKTTPPTLSLSLATSSATSSAVLTVKSTFGNLSSLYIPVTATDKNSTVSHTVSVKIDAVQSTQSFAFGSANEFLLVATPSSIVATSGAPVSFSVAVFGEANATGTVTLSVSPSPIIEKASVLPTVVAIGSSSTVSAVVKQRTPPGSYLVRVVGTNASGISHTTSVTVQVPGQITTQGPYAFYATSNSGVTTIQNKQSGESEKSVARNTQQNQENSQKEQEKNIPVFVPPTLTCQKNIFALFAPSSDAIDATLALARNGDIVLVQPTDVGVGDEQDPTIALAITKLKNRGASVFGVIDGLYGFATPQNNEEEVKKYIARYALDGIAVKNVSTVSDAAAVFNRLATTIKNTYGLKTLFIFSGYPETAYYNTVIDYAVFDHLTLEGANTIPQKDFFVYPAEKRINIVRGIANSEDAKKAVHASRFVGSVGVSPVSSGLLTVSYEISRSVQDAVASGCGGVSQPVSSQPTSGGVQLLNQLKELLANLLKKVTG